MRLAEQFSIQAATVRSALRGANNFLTAGIGVGNGIPFGCYAAAA